MLSCRSCDVHDVAAFDKEALHTLKLLGSHSQQDAASSAAASSAASVEALSLHQRRAANRSASTATKQQFEATRGDCFADLGANVIQSVLAFLKYTELARVETVSVTWCRLAQDQFLWRPHLHKPQHVSVRPLIEAACTSYIQSVHVAPPAPVTDSGAAQTEQIKSFLVAVTDKVHPKDAVIHCRRLAARLETTMANTLRTQRLQDNVSWLQKHEPWLRIVLQSLVPLGIAAWSVRSTWRAWFWTILFGTCDVLHAGLVPSLCAAAVVVGLGFLLIPHPRNLRGIRGVGLLGLWILLLVAWFAGAWISRTLFDASLWVVHVCGNLLDLFSRVFVCGLVWLRRLTMDMDWDAWCAFMHGVSASTRSVCMTLWSSLQPVVLHPVALFLGTMAIASVLIISCVCRINESVLCFGDTPSSIQTLLQQRAAVFNIRQEVLLPVVERLVMSLAVIGVYLVHARVWEDPFILDVFLLVMQGFLAPTPFLLLHDHWVSKKPSALRTAAVSAPTQINTMPPPGAAVKVVGWIRVSLSRGALLFLCTLCVWQVTIFMQPEQHMMTIARRLMRTLNCIVLARVAFVWCDFAKTLCPHFLSSSSLSSSFAPTQYKHDHHRHAQQQSTNVR